MVEFRVRSVVKQYQRVRAVDGVSFDISPGEIFALLGPNGAGKTTLVRMLLGIVPPDSGSIAVLHQGETLPAPPAKRTGYLPEDRGLFKDMSVLATLIYFGRLRGLTRAAAHTAASAWLERMQLADRARDRLSALSKGNQQKIQLGAALLHQPAVAVLDEPFSGLDPVNQELFLELLTELRDNGTTVILSAHQMQLVERAAQRVLLLHRGAVLVEGTLSELRQRYHSGLRVQVEWSAELPAAAVATLPGVVSVEAESARHAQVLLADAGALRPFLAAAAERLPLHAVHSERVTLHDIYVQAVRGAGHAADLADDPAAAAQEEQPA